MPNFEQPPVSALDRAALARRYQEGFLAGALAAQDLIIQKLTQEGLAHGAALAEAVTPFEFVALAGKPARRTRRSPPQTRPQE